MQPAPLPDIRNARGSRRQSVHRRPPHRRAYAAGFGDISSAEGDKSDLAALIRMQLGAARGPPFISPVKTARGADVEIRVRTVVVYRAVKAERLRPRSTGAGRARGRRRPAFFQAPADAMISIAPPGRGSSLRHCGRCILPRASNIGAAGCCRRPARIAPARGGGLAGARGRSLTPDGATNRPGFQRRTSLRSLRKLDRASFDCVHSIRGTPGAPSGSNRIVETA